MTDNTFDFLAICLSRSHPDIEAQSRRSETQLFIETPYRNAAFLNYLAQTVKPTTRITVALDVTGVQEMIRTKTAQEWSNNPIELPKVPAIFAILAQKMTVQERQKHKNTSKSDFRGVKKLTKKRGYFIMK